MVITTGGLNGPIVQLPHVKPKPEPAPAIHLATHLPILVCRVVDLEMQLNRKTVKSLNALVSLCERYMKFYEKWAQIVYFLIASHICITFMYIQHGVINITGLYGPCVNFGILYDTFTT